MNRREQFDFSPTPEKKKIQSKKKKNKFFTTIEQNFQDTESLEELHKLREYSPVHFNHSQEVVLLANRVGIMLGLDDCDLNLLTESALFHDIGKNKIDRSILHKEGKLTDEEFEEMKKHVKYGREIIERDFLVDIAPVMARHHEFKKNKENNYPRSHLAFKLDKSGKDLGKIKNRLGGEGTSVEEKKLYERFKKLARIIAVIDVVQSIADTNRHYNKRLLSKDEVIELAKKELDLEGYEDILTETILAMQESGKYFKDESDNINRRDYHLRYKNENYFT